MKLHTMYRKTFAYGSALLLVVLCSASTFAQNPSPADGQTPGAGINSTPGTSVLASPVDQIGNLGGVKSGQQTSIDRMFIKKALQDSQAKVALGELTLQKSNNDQVKQFARTMIEGQTKLNDQMKSLALQVGVEVPTETSKKDKSLLNKMQGLSGPAYDQAYIKEMVKSQKQDLSAFRQETSNGLGIGLRSVAAQGGKTTEDQLQMAQQLAKDQHVDSAAK